MKKKPNRYDHKKTIVYKLVIYITINTYPHLNLGNICHYHQPLSIKSNK